MKVLYYIFLPILLIVSCLYNGITTIRNFLFNKKLLRSVKFDIPNISVGNLSMGGTGKTPHVEYLIRILKDTYNVATLSRGYGRKTKGFLIADNNSTANMIGDEPLQIYNKFKNQNVLVSVGEQRVTAIPEILTHKENIEVILLDDAYQHRMVTPGLNILLTDYNQPFYNDYVVPLGTLRENRSNKNRADIIIITKCPDNIDINEMHSIKKKVNPGKSQSVFFSRIQYGEPINVMNDTVFDASNSFHIVTGIAHYDKFLSHLNNLNLQYSHSNYKDHHNYKLSDVQNIIASVSKDKKIITTEKDWMRLQAFKNEFYNKKIDIYIIPIEIEILEGKSQLDTIILNYVKDQLHYYKN